jgi:hypothetical protein
MLPLAADEDVHGAVIRAVRRRNPEIDLVTVQEAGKSGSADPDVLEWAASEGRVLISQDERTLIGYAWDRVTAGLPMAGVIILGKGVTIGQAVDDPLLAAECGEADDFKDQVKSLPLS